jgi:hypothetical protein
MIVAAENDDGIVHKIEEGDMVAFYENDQVSYNALSDLTVREEYYGFKVYNLTLDGDHTFIVEGVVVHNKGGKGIVCTEMYRQTGLENWSRAMKIWGLYQNKYMTPVHQEGYHWMFLPVVNQMKTSANVTNISAYFANARTNHLRHVLNNGKTKDDIVGNILCKILHPTVYVAGHLRRTLIRFNIIKGKK